MFELGWMPQQGWEIFGLLVCAAIIGGMWLVCDWIRKGSP